MDHPTISGAALEQAKAAFAIEAACLLQNQAGMDWPAFARAVALLAGAPRIAAAGCGHSGIACRHLVHSLCCINRPARFLPPCEALHGAMGFLQRGDLLVLASHGGKTDELLPMSAIAAAKGVAILAVTGDPASPIARGAAVALPLTVERECDKYNAQGTSSFVALCAIFDALQVALLEHTGYQSGQFALNHPGGAVGKRLNTPAGTV